MEAWRERLDALANRVRIVKRENEQLKARLQEQAKIMGAMEARLMECEQGSKVILAGPEAKPPLVQEGTQKKINELVNEIDQCLALLSAS